MSGLNNYLDTVSGLVGAYAPDFAQFHPQLILVEDEPVVADLTADTTEAPAAIDAVPVAQTVTESEQSEPSPVVDEPVEETPRPRRGWRA